DSLATAAKNKVSMGLAPYVDSKGQKYDETLTHLAVTPVPVLHGLPGFVPLSRDVELDRAAETDGHWVTIHGARVFIKNDKSVGDAIREKFGDTKHVHPVHVADAANQIRSQGG